MAVNYESKKRNKNWMEQRKKMSKHILTPGSGDPLHGITLQTIIEELVAHYGFEELGMRINIRCFTHDPSIKSSLKFLRRTPWARKKVEDLYLQFKA